MAASNRSLSLDGVRGLGVAAPIVVHLGLAGAGNGLWLAIGLFFTLSGFLITTLALKEIDRTGKLSVKGFYARRLRRLMPGAILVLLLIVAIARLVEWPVMDAVRRDVFAALTWSANWEQMQGGGYWESFVPSLTLHFWSLSLEEQIYVVFPLLVVAAAVLLRGRGRPAVKLAWLMGILTVVSWALLWSTNDPAVLYLSTFTRMGEATFGCFVGAVCHLLPARRSDRQASWLIIGLVAFIAPLWVFAVGNETWGIRTGILLATPPTGVVVGLLWRYPASLPARFFALRVPAWLGRRSYGIYLIHLPLIDMLSYKLHTTRLPGGWMVAAVGATIVLASLLFAFVEEPVRIGRVARGPARFAVLLATTAVVLVGLNLQATANSPSALEIPEAASVPTLPGGVTFTLPPSNPTDDPTGSTVVLTNPAPPTLPGNILVIGDSTAWVTAGAVERAMEPLGWAVDAMWMVGCPTGGDARVIANVNGGDLRVRELGDEPGCDEWWNETLPRALIAIRPSMVVFVGGYGLAYEVDPDGDDQWCRLGDGSGRCEEWAAERLQATSDRVHTYAPSAHLVFATGGHVDPWGPLDIPHPAIDVLNTLIRAEAVDDSDSLIDLGSWIDEHIDLTIDGTHLSKNGIVALTPWMVVELEAVVAGRRLAG